MEYEKLSKVKVLLVDDDEDDAVIIKKLVNKIPQNPFVVEWCATFEKAKKLIIAQKHDIYLIDYRLGEKTGLDLLKVVRPAKRVEPFILLTGAGDREVEWRSMKLAAADYLVKGSFTSDMLARTLYYALRRKELEEQRMQHYVELNQSKDEFISIASHQLRTPATAVKQYLGMLLEGFVGELPKDQFDMMQKAYQSNERQLKIVSDLLKVAQVDAGKIMFTKDHVNLNSMVYDAIYDMRDMFINRQQEVEFIPGVPDPVVFIDHDSIRMVLDNLIDNASKYSEEHKKIVITVSESANNVMIHVIDDGVGISTRERARLFEKFSRINNPLSTKVGGTGLGLYWAKKIVDLHDGTITVQSRKGEGATFTISLPKQQL